MFCVNAVWYGDLRNLADVERFIDNRRTFADPGHPSPGGVVLAGLDALLPIMDPNLLKFPNLCNAYFSLVSILAEIHPDHIARLPEPLFGRLVSTLEYGIVDQVSISVAQSSLESLQHLATWHYKEVQRAERGEGGGEGGRKPDEGVGVVGLGPLATTPLPSLGGERVFSYFLFKLIKNLIFDDCPAELIDCAADVILPMLLSDPEGFQTCGQSLLASMSQFDPAARDKVIAALNMVIHPDVTNASLERQNRRKFRQTLHDFFVVTRGVLRTR